MAVAALVLREGQVLLVKRKNPPNAGKWSLPGGIVELGERLEEAVLRELREETGLAGRVTGFVRPVEYLELDGNGRVAFHYVILVYRVEAEPGELRAGDDAAEACFFPLEEAAEREDVTRTTREVLRPLLSPEFRPSMGPPRGIT